MSTDDISRQLLALIQSIPEGAKNDDLEKGFPGMPAAIRVEVLNKLLKEGSIELWEKGDKFVYRSKDPKTGLLSNDEEKIVHGIIAEADNKGILMKDIGIKSNLKGIKLSTILESLETKKLIKAVKSITESERMLYMLYNLEPHRSFSGGFFYYDLEFDREFVNVLYQQCLRFLQTKSENAMKNGEGPLNVKQLSWCSVKEIHTYISDLGISKVTIEQGDLEKILMTVVYDGNAESLLLKDKVFVYRAINSPLPPPGLVQMPCGVCPIIKNCSKCGNITATKCQYLKEWLEN